MKRSKVDGTLERQFINAMINDRAFLAGSAHIIDPDAFPAKFAQTVAGWCLAHFKRYSAAPGPAITTLYRAWKEKDKPEPEEANAVGDFLDALADDTPPTTNIPHLIDELAKYLTGRKLQRLSDSIASALTYGRTDDAIASIQEFRQVPTGATGFAPNMGKSALRRAFAEAAEPLLDFGRDSAWFFDAAFTRDALIGIQGAEKKGKTWWCLEFAHRAIRSRRNVAFFEVGDLSESQLVKRHAMRMAQLPLWPSQCHGIDYPTDIQLTNTSTGAKSVAVTRKRMTFPHPIDLDSGYRAQKKFNRLYKIDSDRPTLMFSIHPSRSISVAGIDSILSRWRDELGFVPDEIIVDYADILAPESPKPDPRHQVNETWSALRRLSQDWHACVVTPTQADAASYDIKTQKAKNFSEDKRKLAHVTGMLGLNQTEAEKREKVMRLNWIVLRESDFDVTQCLWVAQCIPLGQALVRAVKG